MRAVAAGRLGGLALLAAGSLLLEVALTRLLSVLYYPPYVFAVLSLAVLGIGLGAALATARAAWRQAARLPFYGTLAALSTLLVALWATGPVREGGWLVFLVLLLLPYLFAGLSLVTIFSNAAAASPRLYLADLGGAGLGALAAVPVLAWGGALNSVLVAGALLAAAGLLWSVAGAAGRGGWPLPAVALLAVAGLLGSNMATGWLAIDMAALAADKPIAGILKEGGRIVETRWDAFARTDLVAPEDGGPYRLYMDGAAGSVMPPATENDFLRRDIGFFPFATGAPARVFVIGPGGGLDVWFGLQSEAEEIVAVEVNDASSELVEAAAAYNGDLYAAPQVRIVNDEGRSVLRREGEVYDLIFLSQVVTLAAERGGYALVENSTFTVEAFGDYLDHLTADGQVAIKLYDEPTLTRAFFTALAAWEARGLAAEEALQHVMVLLDASADPPIPLLMMRKTAYTEEDSLALGAVAQRVGFVPLYLPQVLAQPPLDDVVAGRRSYQELIDSLDVDLGPTSDDRPFFYQFERGIPEELRPLLWGLSAVLLVGFVGLVWILRPARGAAARWSPLYFAALGAGFMALEVAAIQQTRLFIGHPTLAVTAVLATLLLGGGVGSELAGRLVPPERGVPAWAPAAVAVLALAWFFLWPLLADALLGASQAARLAVTVLSLLPLALLMGIPFPLGLRALDGAGARAVALAWAVNGVLAVVGSAVAMTLALQAGYSRVLLLGAACYVVAALVAPVLRRARRGDGQKTPGAGESHGVEVAGR
jgi:hypothetical protein